MWDYYNFNAVSKWVNEFLCYTCGLGEFWTTVVECILIGICILLAYAVFAIILIFMERKVVAYFQCRLGPVRVGFWGLLQVPADVLKMLIKEIFAVDKADKLLYIIAPFLTIIGSIGAFSCLVWHKGVQVLDFNVGVFFLTAISSIGVLGLFLAGWSSNNKYSVVSAMRGAVQLISYEMSLGLALICAVAVAGTMSLSGIVEAQEQGWLIFRGHLPVIIAFIIYVIAGNAEANRGPFDLPEAESELTAGYHTEYSGMGFGYFYLAEYLNLFIVGAIAATVFLGGWMPFHIPGLYDFNAVMDYIPGFVWMLAKTFFMIWVLMWGRWTFPRLRIDQILTLEWKYLLPISLVNIVLTTIIVGLGWYFK